MTPSSAQADDRLWSLTAAMCDGSITAEDLDRLEALLRTDENARLFFTAYMDLHGRLLWRFRGGGLEIDGGPGARGEAQGMGGSPIIDLSVGDLSVGAAVELPRQPDTEIPGPEPLVPPVIILSPLPSPLYPSSSFVGGPVFSYMVATVILGMMLLGAWAYKITHYHQIAEAPSPAVPSSDRPELVFVGRITGMVDCKWSDPSTEPFAGAYVPLGRKYALASGLMQITYDSGAKVILEGPCTYEVESRRGGFLALGKLTARIEERKEKREKRAKPQAANQKSEIRPPPSAFVVRTPIALITDLGTEFGVEVEQDGNTISHVFRGSVRVQVVASERGTGPIGAKHPPGRSGQLDLSPLPTQGVVLRENESARVEKGDGKPSITRRAAAEDSGFVLAMPPPKSVRDSEAYAKLVLSLRPVVYYRMERPKGGTAGSPSSGDGNDKTLLDKPAVPHTRVVIDSAAGGHHGELRLGNEFGGSPYVPGRFGDALWLRGPAVCDRVVVPDYPKATDDRLTVSAWVLATGRPGWAMIASNWVNSELEPGNVGQFNLGLYRLDGDLRARVTQRDGLRVHIREGISHPFPLFVWQHVAFVTDGTSLRLYRNGREVASSPCAGILPQPPTTQLGIGSRPDNGTGTDGVPDTLGQNWFYRYWQGRIDELAIFNQALSVEQIQQLYLGRSAVTGGGTGVSPVQALGRDTVGSTGETPASPVPLPKRQTEATTTTTKGVHPMNGP